METLVKRAKEDRDGFADLYHQHVGPVYNFFLARVGNVQEAQELMSELLEKIPESAKLDIEKYKAYMNKALDVYPERIW